MVALVGLESEIVMALVVLLCALLFIYEMQMFVIQVGDELLLR